jgi:acetolactate synthase-1/2/3 large subunit
VTGDTPQHWPIKLQLLDQPRFVGAREARYQNVASINSLAADIAEAFFSARLELRPVVLSVPLDLLDADVPDGWTYQPTRMQHSGRGALVPDPAAVLSLADDLSRAKRPVIIAGRGSVIAGARDELMALSGRTGALLGTTLLARGLFSGERLDIGIVGGFAATPTRTLLAEADYVLAAGAELGYFTTQDGSLFPNARIARIDVAPLPWSSGIPAGFYVQGDALETVRRINDALAATGIARQGYDSEQTQEILAQTFDLPPPANDGADPRRLMLRLSEALTDDMIITSGVGHFWSFPAMYLDVPSGSEMRFCHQFGSVGQTLPVAIGQAVAQPDKLHLAIEGDASLMMNVQEFDTAARHRVPLIVLVFNDGGLGAEVHKLNRKGYDSSLASFRSPDFVMMARAVGGDGTIVTEDGQIGAALDAGRKAGGFFVIDARISPSTVSDPYLRTQFGQDVKTPLVQGRRRSRPNPS